MTTIYVLLLLVIVSTSIYLVANGFRVRSLERRVRNMEARETYDSPRQCRACGIVTEDPMTLPNDSGGKEVRFCRTCWPPARDVAASWHGYVDRSLSTDALVQLVRSGFKQP